MTKFTWIVLLAVLITVPAAFSQTLFHAEMSGANEIPPNESTGWGRGIFVLSADQDSLYYSMFWKLESSYSASHIHVAPAGVNGGVVHTLANGNAAGAHGAWAIDAANLNRLLTDSLYINAHSTLWPGGEIRGQILVQEFTNPGYEAILSGLNEIPPNEAAGWGLGTIILSPDQDSLYYALLWKLESSYSASHIHVAPAGVNGGVVHTLANGNATGAHGAWAIDALNLSRLGNDSLYVNAHSTLWPGGEVRGQILAVEAPPVEPDPVTDLVIARIGESDDIGLNWTAVPNVDDYEIYRSENSDIELLPENLIATVTDPAYVDVDAIVNLGPQIHYVVISRITR